MATTLDGADSTLPYPTVLKSGRTLGKTTQQIAELSLIELALLGSVEGEGPGKETPPPEPIASPVVRRPAAGRNQSCPCGSGRKYKRCHLRRGDV